MNKFLFTCPSNAHFAGRKYFSLGEIYNHQPTHAEAKLEAATKSCPVPEITHEGHGSWEPPYAYVYLPQHTDLRYRVTCSRAILWPRVLKVGGSYTEGLDNFYVYRSKQQSATEPLDTEDATLTLPGDWKTVLGGTSITLQPNSGDMQVAIRAGEEGDFDYTVFCASTDMFGSASPPERSHWLTSTEEWPTIIEQIAANDYARDNVPHAIGVFFTTRRWRYRCIAAYRTYGYVYEDPAISDAHGGCFFLEDLTPLF